VSNRILYLQYTNPAHYPPLEHSSRILANAGWKVLFLGTGAYGGDTIRFPKHPNIRMEKLLFCNAGWQQKFHFLWFCLWVIGWVLYWCPNWIYASDHFSCPAGLLLSFFPKIKIIYHEHDSPKKINGISRWIQCILWTRKKLAQRAYLCILPNEKRLENFRLETKTSRPVFCVWNTPSQEEISSECLERRDNKLWVLYHGSIVPSRFPVTIIEAIATLPNRVNLRIIGYGTVGHQGYVNQLRQRATRLGINDRIEFLGTLATRRELLEWCQKCDVGLAFMPKVSEDFNEQTMAGASNKPFDYVASGLVVLVSDLPDWKKMYMESGYGLACDPDNPQSIAQSLQWFLEHPKEMREMGERGRQRILKEWNYEKQFAPVLKELNEAVTAAPRSFGLRKTGKPTTGTDNQDFVRMI